MMWNFHVDELSKGMYHMTLCRDILTALLLNITLSEKSSNQIMDLY